MVSAWLRGLAASAGSGLQGCDSGDKGDRGLRVGMKGELGRRLQPTCLQPAAEEAGRGWGTFCATRASSSLQGLLLRSHTPSFRAAPSDALSQQQVSETENDAHKYKDVDVFLSPFQK